MQALTKAIAEARALRAKATQGPWAYEATGTQSNEWCLGQVVDENDNLLSGRIEEGQGEVVELVCENANASGFADPEYIAFSANTLPLFVDAVERMERALREMSDVTYCGCVRVGNSQTKRCKGHAALLEVETMFSKGSGN
jgi:hypothetical protein